MEVLNIWDSVMTSCQRTAGSFWSWWEGSCFSHPLHHVCCRQSPNELQTGSQCTPCLIHLGLLICLVTEFTACCFDARGSLSHAMTLVPVFVHPVCPLCFAFCLSEMSPQSHSVFGEDELVFGILSLLFICMLVPIVCTRELGTQLIVNFRVNWTTVETAAWVLSTPSCLLGPEFFSTSFLICFFVFVPHPPRF